MRFFRLIIRDLSGLFAIQGFLLLCVVVLTHSDQGDLRTHLAWLAFLIPGWFVAAAWTGSHASLATRYTHAIISSVAIHGCLAGLGYLVGFGFDAYFAVFALLLIATGLLRTRKLAAGAPPQRRQTAIHEIVVWIALMIFVVAVYREPRSNDIAQFSLQQQEMTSELSLQPASIGMTALGVDHAMPRWRSHLWHLWPCLIAEATSLPVKGVLVRWAPIPLAFGVLACLIQIIRSLSGRPTPLWAVVAAVLGPVLLWYRSYNAFNYSFRLTNNFCLDKDLSLFLLVPAVVYLSAKVMRGSRRCVWPLLFLIPAILKFHPLTAVYLVVLLPFLVIGYGKIPVPNRSTWAVVLTTALLFVAVVLIGDAQTSHAHINRIIRMDFASSLQGHPLHYWVGQYGAVRDHGLSLDTTTWTEGRLHLRSRVLLGDGLLVAAHLACLIWIVSLLFTRKVRDLRRWIAIAVVLVMLWTAWLISPWFLARYPHYLAGYERMHWFAFLPALIAVTRAATILGGLAWRCFENWRRWMRPSGSWQAGQSVTSDGWIGASLVSLLVFYSALSFLTLRPTLLTRVRGFNSLLDFELESQAARIQFYRPDAVDQTLESTKPAYLRKADRVVFLDESGNDQYWLIKQGVFWSEPYAEAFALQQRGKDFLEDRRYFYAMLDRSEVPNLKQWLDKKRVTIVVDRRKGADEYLESLNRSESLQMKRVSPGVWRRDAASSKPTST